LALILPPRQKLRRGHHARLPIDDVPSFVAALRAREAVAARCLEYLILTAARSGEVLGARWSEIAFAAKVWTIPPERTKAGREHRIPLCDRALAILAEMTHLRDGEYVFPGQRRNQPLSAMALAMVLRRMGVKNVTVHGFRSCFRDWAGNRTNYPRELAEHALAHVIGDKAEQAYRRDDALERRRPLMQGWGRYCGRLETAKVLQLRANARSS
jgi:integrase